MNEEEIWTDIKGYDGKYQVSNLGRIKTFGLFFRYGVCPEGKIRKLHLDSRGRWMVCLKKNKIQKNHFVHRLVAQHFPPPPTSPNQKCVYRIDGDVNNNRRDNLTWGIYIGGRHIRKITVTDLLSGEKFNYDSIYDFAKQTNISINRIRRILYGVIKKSEYKIEYTDGEGINQYKKNLVKNIKIPA